MIHIENKMSVNPDLVEKGSFLLTFAACFLLLLNSHSFNSIATSALGSSTLQRIEAKANYYVNFGLTEDVMKKETVKDADNSFIE